MKICEACKVSKETSQFWRCAARKDGLHGFCKDCTRASRRKSYAANPDREIAHYRKRQYDTKYLAARRRASAKYTAANREKTRTAIRKWEIRNLAYRAAYMAKRNAEKIRAMPQWANRFLIAEAYRLARLRTETTGIPWHVDHIVPLKSGLVCGLHVEHNLRVIPGSENTAKGNRWWPDMPSDEAKYERA